MNMSEKKLSKFNHVGCLKSDFNVIINNFDKIFIVSPEAVDFLLKFLKEHQFQNGLSYRYGYGDLTLKSNTRNYAYVTELKAIFDNSEPKRDYSVTKLPFHYKNSNWLAHYILQVVKGIEPETRLTLDRIKRFVGNSPQCTNAVMQFEKQLTRTLIHEGITEFAAAETLLPVGKLVVNHYEEMFRNKIINTMDFLGGDLHNVELTLEEAADSWRRQTMTRAFDEYFYPASQEPTDPSLKEKLQELRDQHLNAYLRVKEKLYYQSYSNIINEAGSITENMKVGAWGCLHASEDLLYYSHKRDQFMNDHKPVTQYLSQLYSNEKN